MTNSLIKSSLFLQIVNGLRYFGAGCKVTREIYKKPDTYWVISKVKLSKDQNHGKAFGQLVWNGRPTGKVRKIGSPLKKQWKLLNVPHYATGTTIESLTNIDKFIM